MIDRSAVREALTGPVASLKTPFQRDGEIDEKGLKSLIDFSINAGARTVILTYGDSLYSVLTDQEVASVTKVVVEHTAKRAMLIAADRQWWTGKTVEFAEYTRNVGADMLMVLPPNWGASCTLETFVEHYAAVAENIAVMVVTNVFVRSPCLGLKTLEALHDGINGVMAIKDDIYGEFARRMALIVHDHWAVISGGLKQNHLSGRPALRMRWVFLDLYPIQAICYTSILASDPGARLPQGKGDYQKLRYALLRFRPCFAGGR